jgi:hypothetical protein
MDLETNVSKEFTTENALLLREGAVSKNAVVKVAQTFRTGTNDIDALDYVFMYLNDEKHSHSELHDINDVYVLDNFRPVVTNKNWRIDCGVAGYDNRLGLPPFFPTRLRFEDYIYRLWIHQDPKAADRCVLYSPDVRTEAQGRVASPSRTPFQGDFVVGAVPGAEAPTPQSLRRGTRFRDTGAPKQRRRPGLFSLRPSGG